MTTMIEPPPERPMTTRTQGRLRNRVLEQVTGSHRTRRWVPAVVAATVVTAVAVAGTLIDRPLSENAPAATSRDATDLDRGEATAAQRAEVLRLCVGGTADDANIDYARRIHLPPAKADVTVAVVRLADGTRRACQTHSRSATSGAESSSRLGLPRWVSPSADRPVVDATGPGQWGAFYPTNCPPECPPTGPHADTAAIPRTHWTFRVFRVHESVSRVEMRLVWDGGAGRWYRGTAITDGITVVPALLDMGRPPGDKAKYHSRYEVRAYDHNGKSLPVS
jgi:hypothetical protein